MLNSIEHETSNAHEFKYIKKFSFFSGSDKPGMLFFLLINVKMPTTVGIVTIVSRKISCSVEFGTKNVHSLGASSLCKDDDKVLLELRSLSILFSSSYTSSIQT